jgi:tetratricopeptide (TPR) repeat protein
MDRARRPHCDVEQARQQDDEGSSRSSQPDAASIRLKLGLEDVKTKRFLNHLTRFHYLKRRLDRKAKELLSLSFLNDARYANQKPATPLQQVGEADVAWQRAAAARAQTPLEAIIKSAVQAAGLEPESQPNLFMECGSGFYTAATLGPLKTEARCAEKAKDDYGGDVLRLIDIARASIVVDNEAQLRAVFDALIDTSDVVRLKNRFANPSFNGYRDALFNVRVDGHIAEVQVHLTPFLEQKGEAHKHYKFFREKFHGSEGTVNECLELIDGVVDGVRHEVFSVEMLEDLAAGTDTDKLARLAELFEHRCSLYKVALVFRERAAEVEEDRARGGEVRAYTRAMRRLASLYRRLQKYEAAERCAKKSIQLADDALHAPQRVLGPEVARGLTELGKTLIEEGSLDAAEEKLKRARAIYESATDAGETVGVCARTKRGYGWVNLRLATLEKDRGRYEEAIDFVDQAVMLFRDTHTESGQGEDEESLASALSMSGNIRQRCGRHAEALAHLKQAYEIRQRTKGDEHPHTSTVMERLATSYRIDGDYDSAHEMYAAAERIFAQTRGKDYSGTIRCRVHWAEVCLATGNIKEAERLMDLAMAGLAAAKPTEEPLKQFNVREAHCVLGRIKSAQGLHDDAVGILKPAADAEATHWRHEQGGWMRAALLVAMARQKLAAGASAEEIKPLVDEAVAIRERAFRPKDEVDEARALLE